MLLRC